MKRLTLPEASAILIGTQIGAGVLGLPYALREAGPILGVIVIILTGLLTLLTALFVLEVASKSEGKSLSKLTEEHLGKFGGFLMFMSISILAYGALIAYIAGSADILSSLLGIRAEIVAVIFWIVMSLIVFMGLKTSGEAELILNGVLLSAIVISIVLVFGNISPENIKYANSSAALRGVGVALFAYVSHMVIPELLKGLKDVRITTKAVFVGYLTPMVLYALFILAFIGAFGPETPELATKVLEGLYGSLGRWLGLLLPLAAICTSYIGIALSQMDNIREMLGCSKISSWLLAVAPPLAIYFAGLKSFVNALWLAGTFGGVIYAGILPTLMYLKVKKKEVNFHLHIPHEVVYLSGLIFLMVFVYSLASLV